MNIIYIGMWMEKCKVSLTNFPTKVLLFKFIYCPMILSQKQNIAEIYFIREIALII